MRTGSVLANGVRLAITRQGDPTAPTVLLVHGYPDNSSMWDAVAEVLSRRFHVARYDVRGCGRSQAPDDRAGYRLDTLAADLAAVAGAVSPEAAVHLVGHDWGSIQGWQAVTDPRYTHLFASFTSLSGPCLDHVARWTRRQVRGLRPGPVLRQLARSWYIGLFQLPVLPELVWRLPWLRARSHAEWRDARNGLELYRANFFGRPHADTPRRTAIPVQQIALTRDPFVSPALLSAARPWCGRLWRRELPLGHWAPRTHPTVVADVISEFVGYIEDGRAGPELRRARITTASGPFTGRCALITGAASGIGRATALAFAASGADVIAVDIDLAGAEATAAAARGYGITADAIHADVTDVAALRTLAGRISDRHGVPDIVIANAGIGMAGPFLDTDDQDWQRVLDVNVLGVVRTVRAFVPQLVARGRGGHVVITSSVAAYLPWPTVTAYAATKAAVLSLAQSLRAELAPHGIGVSAICPGIVTTNITETTTFVGQDAEAQRRSRHEVSRLYQRRNFGPERVAEAVSRAVRDNRAVVNVTPEAHVAAVAARVSPALIRAIGGRFRRSR